MSRIRLHLKDSCRVKPQTRMNIGGKKLGVAPNKAHFSRR
jgi:hypothetical protein